MYIIIHTYRAFLKSLLFSFVILRLNNISAGVSTQIYCKTLYYAKCLKAKQFQPQLTMVD